MIVHEEFVTFCLHNTAYAINATCMLGPTLYYFIDSGSRENKIKRSPMVTGSASYNITTIESVMQEPIDEDHPIVQDLVSAGYSVEESIDAVERCETLEEALAYLERKAYEEDGGEAEGVLGLSVQLSREDSLPMDDFKMKW